MLELSMSDKIRRTQFLGREFLTWLMFKAAQGDGVFYDENGKITEISFERALTLDGENPAREMSTIKVDSPMHSEEVMLSLRLGKKVSRARLVVVSEGWEFSLVLDAANLGMRSVKLPNIPAFDAIEHLIEKTELLSTLEDIIHNLFVKYVRIRIDQDAWSQEALAIGNWIANGPLLEEDFE